jgi:hypothetical protein
MKKDCYICSDNNINNIPNTDIWCSSRSNSGKCTTSGIPMLCRNRRHLATEQDCNSCSERFKCYTT